MKTILLLILFAVFSFPAYSEQIIATFDITGVKTNPKGADGGIVLRNTTQGEWLVLWTESVERDFGSPDSTAHGRRVSNNGALTSAKKLNKSWGVLDAEYDPDHQIYMVLVGDTGILYAQAYKTTLAKKGTPQDHSNVFGRNSFFNNTQLAYDSDAKDFRVFAVAPEGGNCSPTKCFYNVHTFKMDDSAKLIGIANVALKGKSGRQFTQLEATPNPATNNTLLLFRDFEVFDANSPDNLLAYVAKPDGKLLKQTAIKVVSGGICPGKPPSISASFDPASTGMIVWSGLPCDVSSEKTNFRRMKASEKGLSAKKQLPARPISPFATNVAASFFDESNGQFVILWNEPGTLKGARINASNNSIDGQPFDLATVSLDPNALIGGVSASYDAVSGRALVVWTEFVSSSKSQVRGVIFEK